jgi:hypothetical protein
LDSWARPIGRWLQGRISLTVSSSSAVNRRSISGVQTRAIALKRNAIIAIAMEPTASVSDIGQSSARTTVFRRPRFDPPTKKREKAMNFTLIALMILSQSQDSRILQYEKEAVKLRDYYSQMKARAVIEQEIISPPPNSRSVTRHINIRYVASSGRKLVSTVITSDSRNVETPYLESVLVEDPHYEVNPPLQFALHRKKKNGSYELVNLDHSSRPTTSMIKTSDAFFMAGSTMDQFSIPDLFESKDFSIKKVENVKSQDNELIKFYFRLNGKNDVAGMEGYFEVNPLLHWVLTSYRFKTDDSFREIEGLIKYAESKGSNPPDPVEVSIIGSYSNKSKRKTIYRIEQMEHDPSPASDFKLSAFGLGDLALPGDTKSYTHLWFFAIAFVAVILSFFLRRYSLRRD